MLHKETIELMNKKMAFIPGGRGFIGTDKVIMQRDGEGPRRPVQLSPYYLDKYEVSNDGIIAIYPNLMCMFMLLTFYLLSLRTSYNRLQAVCRRHALHYRGRGVRLVLCLLHCHSRGDC